MRIARPAPGPDLDGFESEIHDVIEGFLEGFVTEQHGEYAEFHGLNGVEEIASLVRRRAAPDHSKVAAAWWTGKSRVAVEAGSLAREVREVAP
jgi:hypothetical protein